MCLRLVKHVITVRHDAFLYTESTDLCMRLSIKVSAPLPPLLRRNSPQVYGCQIFKISSIFSPKWPHVLDCHLCVSCAMDTVAPMGSTEHVLQLCATYFWIGMVWLSTMLLFVDVLKSYLEKNIILLLSNYDCYSFVQKFQKLTKSGLWRARVRDNLVRLVSFLWGICRGTLQSRRKPLKVHMV